MLTANKLPVLAHAADKRAQEIIKDLRASDTYEAMLTVKPDLTFEVAPNKVLEFAFALFDPANVGIIFFHSPNRHYQRERLGGINVNIEETSERLAQHALYNSAGNYSNIKSELAAAYVRDLFIKQAGGTDTVIGSIIGTLQELFATFLPGKNFLGPLPGSKGELTFPVTLDAGGQHDIDDLSSGEKELVYGYLRLRNVSPENSILLLDEPELHLNPRLVLGLPNFYRKHLGAELNNQLWMTTHSDAFLRDAFRSGGFSLFHLTPLWAAKPNENQAVAISASDQINRAIVDLVGDVAGFRPGNKVVIFESSESANFDAQMTSRLFPEFAEKINALSGDNKSGVQQLYSALQKAVERMSLPFSVFAIVDKDTEISQALRRAVAIFEWDVYHIENYLLEPQFIAKVLLDNPAHARPMARDEIAQELKRCAVETLSDLVAHRIRVFINAQLLSCMDLGFSKDIADPIVGFAGAINRVRTRIECQIESNLSEKEIRAMQQALEADLKNSLQDGSWRAKFRGRDILRRFAGAHLKGLPYEAFRDAIVARMGDAGFQPPGMLKVVRAILDAEN